jgi:outer membrane lipoprotein-sorting protein
MNPIIAALLLLQAQTAEDTFKKIAETLDHAKSVRVSFVWEGTSKAEAEGKVDARGNVLFKEGNRARLAARIQEKGRSSDLRVVSDGKSVKTQLGPKRMLECETPPHFEAGLKMTLHRLGALQAVVVAHKICMLDPTEQEEALDLEKRPALSDFQDGPDDGDAKTITYKVTPEGADSAAEVKLWYRPETYTLVKRTITLKRPAESVFSETYKEWTLDGELENEQFTLPSVK